MKMTRNNILIVALVLVVALTLGYTWVNGDGSADLSNESLSEETVSAPDFTLQDLNGNTVSLSDFKGKYVFLNFWATWCGPCRQEIPAMEEIYNKYQDDLVIVAVNVGEDYDTVSEFAKDYGLTFEILLDEKQAVASLYQVSGIPTSYFLDQEGNFVSGHVGTMTFESMEEEILSMMGK